MLARPVGGHWQAKTVSPVNIDQVGDRRRSRTCWTGPQLNLILPGLFPCLCWNRDCHDVVVMQHLPYKRKLPLLDWILVSVNQRFPESVSYGRVPGYPGNRSQSYVHLMLGFIMPYLAKLDLKRGWQLLLVMRMIFRSIWWWWHVVRFQSSVALRWGLCAVESCTESLLESHAASLIRGKSHFPINQLSLSFTRWCW